MVHEEEDGVHVSVPEDLLKEVGALILLPLKVQRGTHRLAESCIINFQKPIDTDTDLLGLLSLSK